MKPVHYNKVKKTDWGWPDFTPKEIACKGDGMILIDRAAMDSLQRLRTLIGRPLIINSGYRSPEYNKKVGGAPKSQHVLGKAFDIKLTKEVSRDLIKYLAPNAGFSGIGDYDTFVHVDTGPQRYWDLRTSATKGE